MANDLLTLHFGCIAPAPYACALQHFLSGLRGNAWAVLCARQDICCGLRLPHVLIDNHFPAGSYFPALLRCCRPPCLSELYLNLALRFYAACLFFVGVGAGISETSSLALSV